MAHKRKKREYLYDHVYRQLKKGKNTFMYLTVLCVYATWLCEAIDLSSECHTGKEESCSCYYYILKQKVTERVYVLHFYSQ